MTLLRRGVVALLVPLTLCALASPSFAEDKFRPGVSLDDPIFTAAMPLPPMKPKPPAQRAEPTPQHKPNIALDLGPGIGIVDKPAAVREKPIRSPLLLDTRLPGPALDDSRLSPASRLLDRGPADPPGPPPDWVQSAPTSASIQNYSAPHGMTLTVPVAKLLRSVTSAPSN